MKRSLIPPMVILILLILSSSTASVVSDIEDTASKARLQPLAQNYYRLVMGMTMAQQLLERDENEQLEAIVQFDQRPGDREYKILEHLEFEIKNVYTVLPAVSLKGSIDSLIQLTGYPSLKWMEPNWEIVHDMELSTSVINASRTWSREIVDKHETKVPIDGTDVTVVVVDTGIDAGHPDLDYGEKTIFNKFLDTDTRDTWVEQENTDLYYGHGTHVAGTVAGNGDASAGSRRGVAPGANLIGVTLYDPTAAEYLVALEWVYEHSKPNANPYNIRCATNSWHTIEAEYDPNSALSQIIMKLAYENNVVTTWSAGNEGRTDPEGTTVTTSYEGNTPVAVMVAAYERDGSAVTDFSSRGQVGLNHTYPDIGAPGRTIWSTSARRTVISGGTYVGGNTNPYYLAISGTSMSTPHIAGLVALLFQAAPSLTVSEMHEDYSGTDDSWWSNPETRIHEVEWILEASCTYLDPSDETGVFAEDNSTGWDGRPIDYAQGYGIVDVEKAVGIALTLERLRAMHPDKAITVKDALRSYRSTLTSEETLGSTNILTAEWAGEFSRYNDQFGKPVSAVNQTKHVYAPENAELCIVDMQYNAVSIDKLSFGDITFVIDYDMDGNDDYTGTLAPTLGEIKHEEFAVSSGSAGTLWSFDIIGEGFKLVQPLRDRNYVEFRIEYEMSVQFVLSGGGGDGSGENNETGIYVPYAKFPAIGAPLTHGTPGTEYSGEVVTIPKNYFDLTEVVYHPADEPTVEQIDEKRSYWPIAAVLIILIIIFIVLMRLRRIKT